LNLPNFLIVLLSVLLNAAAQIFLKKGSSVLTEISLKENLFGSILRIISDGYIWGGLACYGFSVAVWIYALSRVDVSTAYPMLSIGFIVSVLAAYIFLGESLSLLKIAGIVFITIGVLIISKS
jgi:multidrug transporter EmrE-like cation transporter